MGAWRLLCWSWFGLAAVISILPVPVWTLRSAADPLFDWARGDKLKTRSDSEGGFVLHGLQTKSALLRIEAANRARRYVEVVLPDEDSMADLGDLALEPGCEVTVEAGEGTPQGLIARLDLRGQWLDSDMLTASVLERQARFANVPQGMATVSLMDGPELVCERQIEVPDEPTLTIDCEPGGQRVSGLVQVGDLPNGPGLLVWSRATERRPGVILKRRSGHLQTDQVLWGGRPDVRVTVDPSGHFDTDQLSAGEWRVTWSANGGGPGGPQTTLRLSGQRYQETTLSFAETVVRGRVLDLEGDGVSRAHVRALGRQGFAISGAEGRFSVTGLEPGPIRLQAKLGGASSEVAALILEADRAPEAVDLTLIDRRPSIEVRVDTEARGAAGAFVFIESEGQGIRQLTTDHRGRVAVALHPPLPSRLRAAAWSGGNWVFGSWLSLDRAREGVELVLSQGGGVELACASVCSGLRILTSEDWELVTLSARLGRLLHLSEAEPLVATGLPPGSYSARTEGGAISFVVEAGSVESAELP